MYWVDERDILQQLQIKRKCSGLMRLLEPLYGLEEVDQLIQVLLGITAVVSGICETAIPGIMDLRTEPASVGLRMICGGKMDLRMDVNLMGPGKIKSC